MVTVFTDVNPFDVKVNDSGKLDGTNVDAEPSTLNWTFPLGSFVKLKYNDCGFNPEEFDKVEPTELRIV
jgi:hypothetical protein